MNRNKLTILIIWLGLGIENPGVAQPGGVMAVIAPHKTTDGRALLWKNHDSEQRNCKVIFQQGPRYDFMAVVPVDNPAQVWMGLNTAGFGLVYTLSEDVAGEKGGTEGDFARRALGACGRIEDFEAFLDASQDTLMAIKAHFACIDHFNGCALFQVGNDRFQKWDVARSFDAPDGYLVRSNFSMDSSGAPGYYSWRYHRTRELIGHGLKTNRLSYGYLLRTVARDLASPVMNPYPLPSGSNDKAKTQRFISTAETINHHQTVAGIVIQSPKPNEKSALATLWVLLGEPVCSIAVPLWPVTGKVPEALTGATSARLNRTIQAKEKQIYPKRKQPELLSLDRLVGGRRNFLDHLFETENKFLARTEIQLNSWRFRSFDTNELLDLQEKTAQDILRQMR